MTINRVNLRRRRALGWVPVFMSLTVRSVDKTVNLRDMTELHPLQKRTEQTAFVSTNMLFLNMREARREFTHRCQSLSSLANMLLCWHHMHACLV